MKKLLPGLLALTALLSLTLSGNLPGRFEMPLGAAQTARPAPLNCALAAYKASPGLTAAVAGDALVVTWDGEKDQEVRLQLAIAGGTPTVRDLSVRRKGSQWASLASNVTPDFHVVTARRRISDQQLAPMHELGIDTPENIEAQKWNAFWDAPLDIPGVGANGRGRNPDVPRKPEEIKRAAATYQSSGCEVKTNGGRLEASSPGAQLGIFSGRLLYTVYKGTNLIRQELIASTDQPSVAYKYDAGLKGFAIQAGTRVLWRDTANVWQDKALAGGINEGPVPLRTANRLVFAEAKTGSVAAFPPPHTFFWAREVETNLGYNWYRKDSNTSFAIGVRQAEQEDVEQYKANFALYSAPPGTLQRMAVYFYPSPDNSQTALQAALAFTNADRYRALPGYVTMAHHYHTQISRRLQQAGSLDARLADFDVIKAAGVNIMSPADFHVEQNNWNSGDIRFKNQADYYEGAKRHSDDNFLIMTDEEVDCDGAPAPCPAMAYLGAHWDLLYSHPVFWTRTRAANQSFMETHPKYGKVYHVGSVAEMMEMIKRENMLVYMPHPRTKGSTGYPDAVKDTDHFKDPNYRGIGWRWGMGSDLSEQRLSENRATKLFDDMNNWVANQATPPKYVLAITETRYKAPGDDIYGMSPINYVKIDRVPSGTDWSPVINALKAGNYFVSSGEVLIPSFAVKGAGDQRTVTAEVQWTFPLEFVEVVWGDGQKTDRQIIPATDLPPFGKHSFQIPFNAAGKKWVRFAVWDSAGNGAMVQPIKLEADAPATASR